MIHSISLNLATLLFATALFAPATAQADDPNDPQAEIQTALVHWANLLDENKYAEFAEGFFPPKDFKTIKESGFLDQIIKTMEQDPMTKKMPAVFRTWAKQPPKYNAEKTTATYQIPEGFGKGQGPDEATFAKTDGKWHMSPTIREEPRPEGTTE